MPILEERVKINQDRATIPETVRKFFSIECDVEGYYNRDVLWRLDTDEKSVNVKFVKPEENKKNKDV